ncbi:MAG: mechanosensitive ion channel family protein [Rickettsiaceae bacterium]|nr:mechanosensitive ion channel family protein [Rickettsiaceae bacterium]
MYSFHSIDYALILFFVITIISFLGNKLIEKICHWSFVLASIALKINIIFFQPILKPAKVFVIGLIIFISYLFTIQYHFNYLDWAILKSFNLFIVTTTAWAGYSLAGFMIPHFLNKRKHEALKRERLNEEVVVFLLKIGRICITLFAIIAILNILGINVVGLAAGLGLAGIALGLAAQDSLKNFFATITILLDNVFAEGDHIKIDNIDGIIEYVGFRSTRILSSDHNIIFIPNFKLAESIVTNYTKTPYKALELNVNITNIKPDGIIEKLMDSLKTSLYSSSTLLKVENVSMEVKKIGYNFITLKFLYTYKLKENSNSIKQEFIQKVYTLFASEYPGSSANVTTSF